MAITSFVSTEIFIGMGNAWTIVEGPYGLRLTSEVKVSCLYLPVTFQNPSSPNVTRTCQCLGEHSHRTPQSSSMLSYSSTTAAVQTLQCECSQDVDHCFCHHGGKSHPHATKGRHISQCKCIKACPFLPRKILNLVTRVHEMALVKCASGNVCTSMQGPLYKWNDCEHIRKLFARKKMRFGNDLF